MVAAAVGIGAAVAGTASAVVSSKASKKAAATQAQATENAAKTTLEAQQQLRGDLSPYTSVGTAVLPSILEKLGYTGKFDDAGNLTGISASSTGGTQPFSFDASDLQSTPGYQFTLDQGNRAVNNQAAASGLNLSGAQLKGISDYTTGLADQTYNQQYQNALNTYNTNYNVNQNQLGTLMSLLGVGQSSAAQTGVSGLNAATAAGNQLTSGANAIAAGQVASGQATSNAISSISNGASLYALLNSK